MTRAATLMLTILPALTVGGLLLSSAPGHAEVGRDDALGFWPTASDTTTRAAAPVIIAQADPRPRPPRPPRPPMPPPPPTEAVPAVPPVPPTPPTRSHGRNRGMSFSIHDGKIEIEGIADMVQEQLERVADVLDSVPDLPPDVRDRVKSRVKAVRDRLTARLGKLKSLDLDKIGPEMERLGDDIEKEMAGLDKDLAQLNGRFGKKLTAKFGKDFLGKDFGKGFSGSRVVVTRDSDDSDDSDDNDSDDDDKPAVPSEPDASDPWASRPAIAGMKKLTLDAAQRERLAKLRADSDHEIASAKRDLEDMSNRLHDALGDASVNETEIARQIDQISAKEAVIRKARVLSWVRARNVLRKDQQKLIEAAAKKSHSTGTP